MSTSTHRPEVHQLGGLLGMQQFRWWAHPELTHVGFSDIDAWQHSRKGNRHLFADFKTSNEDLSRMGGQLDGLMDLSRLPGCQVLIIFDPHHGHVIHRPMDLSTPIRVELLRNGSFASVAPMTLGRLQAATFEWRECQGALNEPTPDYGAMLDQYKLGSLSRNETLEQMGLANIHAPSWKAWKARTEENKRQASARDQFALLQSYPKRPADWAEHLAAIARAATPATA